MAKYEWVEKIGDSDNAVTGEYVAAVSDRSGEWAADNSRPIQPRFLRDLFDIDEIAFKQWDIDDTGVVTEGQFKDIILHSGGDDPDYPGYGYPDVDVTPVVNPNDGTTLGHFVLHSFGNEQVFNQTYPQVMRKEPFMPFHERRALYIVNETVCHLHSDSEVTGEDAHGHPVRSYYPHFTNGIYSISTQLTSSPHWPHKNQDLPSTKNEIGVPACRSGQGRVKGFGVTNFFQINDIIYTCSGSNLYPGIPQGEYSQFFKKTPAPFAVDSRSINGPESCIFWELATSTNPIVEFHLIDRNGSDKILNGSEEYKNYYPIAPHAWGYDLSFTFDDFDTVTRVSINMPTGLPERARRYRYFHYLDEDGNDVLNNGYYKITYKDRFDTSDDYTISVVAGARKIHSASYNGMFFRNLDEYPKITETNNVFTGEISVDYGESWFPVSYTVPHDFLLTDDSLWYRSDGGLINYAGDVFLMSNTNNMSGNKWDNRYKRYIGKHNRYLFFSWANSDGGYDHA